MSLYKEAITEYKNANREVQTKTIYLYFGLAVYHAQLLEQQFALMLIAIRLSTTKKKNNINANDIIDSIEGSKNTMGMFINEVTQVYELPKKVEDELESILLKRNYLVHRYFKSEFRKFYSSEGCLEMLKYFCDFIEQEERIDSELQLYFQKYALNLGLTEDKISKMIEDTIKAEMKTRAEGRRNSVEGKP